MRYLIGLSVGWTLAYLGAREWSNPSGRSILKMSVKNICIRTVERLIVFFRDKSEEFFIFEKFRTVNFNTLILDSQDSSNVVYFTINKFKRFYIYFKTFAQNHNIVKIINFFYQQLSQQ